jgi:hypothetical protein
MIKFFKMIQEHEMFAMVRIGPFVQAEWNHGFVRLVCFTSHTIDFCLVSLQKDLSPSN